MVGFAVNKRIKEEGRVSSDVNGNNHRCESSIGKDDGDAVGLAG
jgi:hypothetical protein